MSTVTINGTRLEVHPTRAERLLGLVRDLEVPLTSIRPASAPLLRDAVPGSRQDEGA